MRSRRYILSLTSLSLTSRRRWWSRLRIFGQSVEPTLSCLGDRFSAFREDVIRKHSAASWGGPTGASRAVICRMLQVSTSVACLGIAPCVAQAPQPTPIAEIGDWRLVVVESTRDRDVCLAMRSSSEILHTLAQVGQDNGWRWYFRPLGAWGLQKGQTHPLKLQFDQAATLELSVNIRSQHTLALERLPPQLLEQIEHGPSERMSVRLDGYALDNLDLRLVRAVFERLAACQREMSAEKTPVPSLAQVLPATGPEVATSVTEVMASRARVRGLPPAAPLSAETERSAERIAPVLLEQAVAATAAHEQQRFVAQAPAEHPAEHPSERAAAVSRSAAVAAREAQAQQQPDAQAPSEQAERQSEALRQAEQDLRQAQQTYGAQHPETTKRLTNLALVLYSEARYADAVPVFEQALAVYREALGRDHPSIGVLLSYLASAYKHQGRYTEAEKLYQESLALAESTLGPEHPETAMSLNSLALLYHLQGRYSEAETLFKRAIETAQQALGSRHEVVIAIRDNLAGLYSSAGRHADAEAQWRETIELKQARLGPDHPETALASLALAKVYRDQRRYADAERLFDEALPILRSHLEPNNPDILIAVNNLAGLYGLQGRYDEAAALLEDGVDALIEAVGEEHLQVATALNNLALVYRAQGQPERAWPLHRRALRVHQMRFEQGLPPERGNGMSTARSHALAYLQLLARLEQPDEQAQADMLIAMQLARGGESDEMLYALAGRLVELQQETLNRLSPAEPPVPLQSVPWDAASFSGISRRLIDQESLRAALRPGEAALAWIFGPEESYLLRVSNGGEVALEPLTVSEDDIEAQLQQLDFGQHQRFPAGLTSELFAQLFGPGWEQDLQGVERLVLVPEGALNRLGFPALLTEPTPQAKLELDDDAYESASWLTRRFDIRVLPTLSVVAVLPSDTSEQ